MMLPQYDSWKIVRKIGSGSFGTVYEIEREDFGVQYRAALKVLSIPQSENEVENIRSSGMTDDSITEYFRDAAAEIVTEFELMSKLKGNTNIVSYEDHRVVPHANGIGWDIYIRMELLTSLNRYLAEHPITRRDVIRLGIDLCQALERCQKFNIIHRDIKPDNIFVSDQGDFKLGDFGIARTAERTMSGMSKKGTYNYMAPEVYKGQAYGYSVDLYSLGLVMYRLLNNNRTPFMPPYPQKIRYRDQEQALVRRMSGEQLPYPCRDNTRLGEIVLKACSYQPKDRYSSPLAMRKDLQAILYDDEERERLMPSDIGLLVPISPTFSGSRSEPSPVRTSPGVQAGPMEESVEATVSILDRETQGAGNVASQPEQSTPAPASAPEQPDEPEEGTVSMLDEPEEGTVSMLDEPEEGTVSMLDEPEEGTVSMLDEPEEGTVSMLDEPEEGTVSMLDGPEEGTVSMLDEPEEGTVSIVGAAVAVPEAAESAAEQPRPASPEKKPAENAAGTSGAAVQKKRLGLIAAAMAVLMLLGAGIGVFHFSSTTVVPDVAGMTEIEAKTAIAGASLETVETVEENSDSVERGVVIRTEETGRMQKNSGITLVVSAGAHLNLPDFVGKSFDECKAFLEQEGLVCNMETAFSSEYEKGTVLAQEPAPGTAMNDGDSVTLTVSVGEELTQMGDYVGMNAEKARDAAKEAGFQVEIVEEYSDEVKKGRVISQQPAASATVKSGTKVRMIVSLGAEMVEVPDLIGMSEKEAKSALKKVGLKLGDTEKEYNDAKKGTVIAQGKDAGTKVKKDSRVSVTLSRGPEPESDSDDYDDNGSSGSSGSGKKSSGSKKKSSSSKKKSGSKKKSSGSKKKSSGGKKKKKKKSGGKVVSW